MPEILGHILTAVISSIASVICAYLVLKKDADKTKANYDIEFIGKLMEQIKQLNTKVIVLEESRDYLKNELERHKKEIHELEKKISEQFNHIEILEAYYEHMPGPAWMKDVSGTMFFINTAYEKVYGISKTQYQNRTDVDVWGEKIGRQFQEHDNKVKQKRKGMHFNEKVPRDPEDLSKGYDLWDIWKWPIFIKGRLIAVGGIALQKIYTDE